ncbi:head GIN domain-containing protein [Plebeiibacterium sediminum]|uniref:DUF2807 domain-containing protein n=1 Tax=Plebeiibacterium sediminum TaxID=2992112 RepID=A0AAE3M6R3_9BACT|nr:head GIN domain-containing protein [Plebeiobacterium sediminum]MCW3787865.1 DUF2807 domain-containing protein [Plebeiobacterium sediminum]
MKKIALLCIAIISVINVIAQEPKSQSRNVGSFNEIYAGKGVNVTLIEGDKEKIRVDIENADVTDVITEIKGRKLEIKLKTKIYKDMSVMVYATYKSLKAISAGTGAFITSDNVLYAENLDLKAGTGSSIILDLDVKNLSASLSSSKIEVVGKVDFQDVTSNTGGRYIANKLTSREAIIKAYTGGVAWVNASDKLEAKTNTGGKITYSGNPKELISKGNIKRDE